jgi:hypothetical protein
MTNEMLRDAFHGIADRAVPPPEGIAERALRQASRRRTTMITGVAAGTIAAVTAPLLLFNLVNYDGQARAVLNPGATSSPRASGVTLPDNTPAQRTLAKSCADLPDVRLLARSVDRFQFILVGNEKTHRTCMLNTKGKVSHSFAEDSNWDPTKISDPLTLLRSEDVVIGNSYVQHTAGVVTPAVAKLVMTSLGIGVGKPGYYRLDLSIKTGFFVTGTVVPRGEQKQRKSELIAYDARNLLLLQTVAPPYR